MCNCKFVNCMIQTKLTQLIKHFKLDHYIPIGHFDLYIQKKLNSCFNNYEILIFLFAFTQFLTFVIQIHTFLGCLIGFANLKVQILPFFFVSAFT